MGTPAAAERSPFRTAIRDLAQEVAASSSASAIPSRLAPIFWPLGRTLMASFGRLRSDTAEAEPEPSVLAIAPTPGRSSSSQPITELRNLCLLRIDPAAVAALPPDRLGPEIERLVAEIATERRIQLNGREQRQVASDLVHDMLGLGPLQLLLDDDTISDIMVNGPERVFVERGGKVFLSDVRFRDAAACRQHLPAHRVVDRPPR